MAKKNETAPVEETAIMVANPVTGELVSAESLMESTRDELMEELDGVGTLTLDSIKVPGSGGKFWEISDASGEVQAQKTIECVIVFHSANNVYFSRSYDEAGDGDNRPDCSSHDGKTGVLTDTGATISCAKCKFNQFGSKGSGKACSNRMKLYILRDGMDFPEILNLPTTSVKAFKAYLGNIVTKRRKKMCFVKTSIGLEQVRSSGGIEYSACTFRFGGFVDPEDAADMLQWRETCRTINDASAMPDDQAEQVGGQDDFVEISEEELPDDRPF